MLWHNVLKLYDSNLYTWSDICFISLQNIIKIFQFFFQDKHDRDAGTVRLFGLPTNSS